MPITTSWSLCINGKPAGDEDHPPDAHPAHRPDARPLSARDAYIDVMQKSVEAYTDPAILRYIEDVERDGIREHGFARLTANIGILLSQGRIPQKRELFQRMMDLCVRQIPVALKNDGGAATGCGCTAGFSSVPDLRVTVPAAELAVCAATEFVRGGLAGADALGIGAFGVRVVDGEIVLRHPVRRVVFPFQ